MDLSALTPAHRRAGAGLLLVAVVLVVAVPRLTKHGPAAATVPPLRAAVRRRAGAAASAQELVVDVAGAVRRPGLYHLPPGTRIADAVAAAGGVTAKADEAAVNLASPLADGEQVLVPGPGAAGAGGGGGAASAAAPVDLNSATPEQLDTLPGVGPSTAAKIVAFRQAHGPFHSVEELDAVPGIGPSRIAELKGLVLP